jgi:UDP-glucose 4-epimerase
VLDLAAAHVAALEHLPDAAGVYNLGTGTGNSVLEVIGEVERVTGLRVACEQAPRRAGDPPSLVASHARAAAALAWTPERSLETIVSDAWAWLRDHPSGYGD